MRGWIPSVSSFAAIAGLLVCAPAAAADLFKPPAAGWGYGYEANAGQGAPGSGGAAAFDALDGTYGHDNNSDTWDGTEIGVGGAPGGVSLINDSYLRIQDTGDPRDHGFPDPSSRKIYLGHKLSANGFSATFLNDAGATLHFRMRLATTGPLDQVHPDSSPAIPPSDWPAGGKGYRIHDNGKGMIGIHQGVGGTGLISFSLATPGDHAEVTAAGLITNHLNGNIVTEFVDVGEAGTPNFLALDPTQWHEFWISISPGGAGTHQVAVYVDGSFTPAAEFDVTAGTGDDVGDSYLSLGMGSTGQFGAFDVDFVRVAAEAMEPPPPPKFAPALSTWAFGFLALAVLGLGAFLLGRRSEVTA